MLAMGSCLVAPACSQTVLVPGHEVCPFAHHPRLAVADRVGRREHHPANGVAQIIGTVRVHLATGIAVWDADRGKVACAGNLNVAWCFELRRKCHGE